jgi:hypothetical protein
MELHGYREKYVFSIIAKKASITHKNIRLNMNGKEKMIERDLKGRDITNERVLKAMEQIDREIFVPDGLKCRAYEDIPLPIGRNQTISQPYFVAYMAQIIDPQP